MARRGPYTVMPGTAEQLKRNDSGIPRHRPDCRQPSHKSPPRRGNDAQTLPALGGRRPIALVRRCLGMIGDPSMKKPGTQAYRREQTLRHNQGNNQTPACKIPRFRLRRAPNSAELVNNYDWMKATASLDFIRDIGKAHHRQLHFDGQGSVKTSGPAAPSGNVVHRFSYQLLQGYDFLSPLPRQNCRLQLGGSDQWGNMTTSTENLSGRVERRKKIFSRPVL